MPCRQGHYPGGLSFRLDQFSGGRSRGITSSPSFVREPQGNGCAERFIRTLKEQLLWVETFATVEELRLALLSFKERYNRAWLIERHAYRSPAQVRAAWAATAEVAA